MGWIKEGEERRGKEKSGDEMRGKKKGDKKRRGGGVAKTEERENMRARKKAANEQGVNEGERSHGNWLPERETNPVVIDPPFHLRGPL